MKSVWGTSHLASQTYQNLWKYNNWHPTNQNLRKCNKNLQKTFNQLIKGTISVNELPLNINKLEGTEFQKKVWKSIAKIKYGTICSYKEIAVSINNPSAARAVGSACRLNPIPLIIPCHRVLRSDGSIGKYAFGIKNKHKLLELESYESRNRNKK